MVRPSEMIRLFSEWTTLIREQSQSRSVRLCGCDIKLKKQVPQKDESSESLPKLYDKPFFTQKAQVLL